MEGSSLYKPYLLPQPQQPVHVEPRQQPQAVQQPQPVVKLEISQASIEERVREVFGVDAQERKKQDDRIEQLRTNQEELGKQADGVREKLSKASPSAQARPKLTLNRAALIVEGTMATKVSEAFAAIEKIDEKREEEKAAADPATQVEEESHETEKPGEEPLPEEPPRRILPILRRRRRFKLLQ